MKHSQILASAAVMSLTLLCMGAGQAGATQSVGVSSPTEISHGQLAPKQASSHPSPAAGAVVALDTITCTPNVQNPHNSSHVNGTINVVVTLTCTAPVSQINIRAALYKNGTLVKDSGQKTFNGTASAQNNAAVPCSNGTYQGWMSYGVAFPAGYTPPTGASSGYGNAVSITC